MIYKYLISYFNDDAHPWSQLGLGSGDVLKRGRGLICVPIQSNLHGFTKVRVGQRQQIHGVLTRGYTLPMCADVVGFLQPKKNNEKKYSCNNFLLKLSKWA